MTMSPRSTPFLRPAAPHPGSPHLSWCSLLPNPSPSARTHAEFLWKLLWKAGETFACPGASCSYALVGAGVAYGERLCWGAAGRWSRPPRAEPAPARSVQGNLLRCMAVAAPRPHGRAPSHRLYCSPQRRSSAFGAAALNPSLSEETPDRS